MAERPLSAVSNQSIGALAANTALPAEDDLSFVSMQGLPRPPYFSDSAPIASPESPRDSFVQGSPHGSGGLISTKYEEVPQDERAAEDAVPRRAKRRPIVVILIALIALVIVILAVVLPVYFMVIKPRNKNGSHASSQSSDSNPTGDGNGGSTGNGNTTSTPPVSRQAVTGGDGSTVKLVDGSTFVYNNKFGGIWYADPDDPFNNNAYPNSWTPPLNQSWDYGKDRIYGVNIGGWFVLEPFISPEIFQRYPSAQDEWDLSTQMAADPANGGLSQIEEHYKTFITEQDIAAIAAAGLNWIRLPIPYWAVGKLDEEPFLEKTSWKYIVQAFQWCRKYGLRIKLDLHTIPGSQNGYNHSGKKGSINFLMGTMGMANAQRALDYMRVIMEFISQPEWRDVVVMFGIMNEARIGDIGRTELRGFYIEAYEMLRGITGEGTGKGPFISIHDGFQGLSNWAGFMSGADRVALDQHPYFAFDTPPSRDPIDTGVGAGAGGNWPSRACERWAGSFNTSRTAFGVSLAGEWSNSINDCGLYLMGVNGTTSYSGSCASDWEDARQWTEGTKAGLLALALASMDSFRDWFFWTWKIAPAQSGIISSPLWSYSAGLAGGWMPADPRSAIGACGAPSGPVFDGTFDSWMTGGAGAGVIAASQTAQFPYPPTDLQGTPVANLPLYTPTGTIATLPAPTYTDTKGKTIAAGNGWFNPNDVQLSPTAIPGCNYPDPWDAVTAAIPTGCTAAAAAAAPAAITPPPRRR